MRKIQVQKSFEAFCGDYLIPAARPVVYGGVKCPEVHFEIGGIDFTYSALKNCVIKPQARDTLEFENAKAVLVYVKKMEAMKALDPHSRGRYD